MATTSNRRVESAPTNGALARIEAIERELAALREDIGVTTATADPELVTLTEAAEQLADEVHEDKATLRARFQAWFFRGHLAEADRRPGPHKGIALVRLSDVRALLADPPKRTGRPRKAP